MSPNELFDNNQRLVGLAIKQLGLRPQGIMGMDDYFQVGYVGLWRAAQSFDPDRGFAFSTFAVAWIKGVLMKERRDHGCNAVRLPRSAFERGDRVHVVDLDELYSAPAASVPEDSESRMDIENAMQSLTAKEREALEYRLQGGFSVILDKPWA